jgi:hypothetical protein
VDVLSLGPGSCFMFLPLVHTPVLLVVLMLMVPLFLLHTRWFSEHSSLIWTSHDTEQLFQSLFLTMAHRLEPNKMAVVGMTWNLHSLHLKIHVFLLVSLFFSCLQSQMLWSSWVT